MIIQAFLRGAVIIAVAALLATLLRHRSAAVRHHVWATAVVVQLALLAFIPVLPTIHLPVIPTITAEVAAPLQISAVREEVAPSATQPAVISEESAADGAPPATGSLKQVNWLLLVWITGAAIVFLRYLIGTLVMLRLSLKSERVEDGEWLVLAQRTARELGITRPITMIWGDQISVPITWGVLYPMILLPKSAREWPQERRRFVLVHEMAHVKRFDAFTQLLAQVTAAIFWFSPFVWIAEWRMRVEREHACDDTVIRHGTEPTQYADELLQMVRTLVRRRAQQPAFAALAMARKSEFEGRMLAILDPERPRRVTGVTSGVVFALLSVLIAAPLAALDPFAVRVATIPTVEIQAAAPPATPRAEAARPTTRASRAETPQDCRFDGNSNGTHAIIDNEGTIEVRLQRDARCLFTDISGPVKLSDDERRILAVEPGGYVRVREVVPGRNVQLLIERKDGETKRAFTINGRRPDDEGSVEREWLARVLPEALAEGGIRTQDRVERMLKSNGLNPTIRQIAALTSISARTYHFKALLTASDWSSAELDRIVTAARESLKASPSDLASFKSAVPRSKPAAAPAKVVKSDVELMEHVLRGITSSYDLRMAMNSQLPRADKAMLLMFARVGKQISSSYELGTFLTEAKEYYLGRNDVDLENAWFTTAAGITSPTSRRNTLQSALGFAAGSESITLKLLRASTDMSSGVEKAGLLAAIAQKKLINTPALRTEFLAQMNSISSGVERRLVLEALGSN